jgi:hypothetical protein
VRWLLPFLTVFALIGQAVTAYAAAGVIGEASCCCPVKAKCKCHDHDGKSDSSPALNRCAGEAKLVAPAVASAVPVAVVELASEPHVTAAPFAATLPSLDDVSREPEKPPF